MGELAVQSWVDDYDTGQAFGVDNFSGVTGDTGVPGNTVEAIEILNAGTVCPGDLGDFGTIFRPSTC